MLFDFETSSLSFLSSYLLSVKLEGYGNAFVIGTFDHKKTIATQQKRAAVLALASTLSSDNNDLRVAVVGAGFAGITCTSTLLKLGHRVTLFEQKDRLLPVQARCSSTYIHPNLYDWPGVDLSESFKISGLSWRAGYCNQVTSSALKSFNAICKQHSDSYREHYSVKILDIEDIEADQYELVSSTGRSYGPFDLVFFAVGFGSEKQSLLGNRIRGYWDTSGLDYIHGIEAQPDEVLVSGSGDGGLIAVLNCAFRDFEHASLYELASALLGDQETEVFQTAESRIKAAVNAGNPISISRCYDEVFGHRFGDWKSILSPLISRETRVTFNSKARGIFSPGSAAVNRLLVYALLRTELIEFRPFELSEQMVEETTEDDKRLYIVDWPGLDKGRYQHLIVRHGVSRNFFEQKFVNLSQAVPTIRGSAERLRLEDAVPADVLAFLTEL